MNYELAKELKEAGFPQDKSRFLWSDHTTPPTYWDGAVYEETCKYIGQYPTYAVPTLEELIEACGEGLQFNLLETSIGLFQASCWIDARGEERISRSGSTPTEAVARLWLALNPKK